MASPNTSIPLANVIWLAFLIFFGSVQLCLCFTGNTSKSGSCTERERKALLSIQRGIYDAGKWLSWNGKDCCRWKGVRCDTITGHVIKLDLHYRNPDPCDAGPAGYVCYERPRNKSEVSPSLLDLRHLNYLDLSMNNFDGAPIPDFIGSLANLEYLNLSNAGFGGTIPHRLGNLSNLVYLDLNDPYIFYSLDVDNLGWLAQIHSLQHLDMSYVNLSKASNWIHAINMLPSLSVLYLSRASLSILPSTLPHVNFTSLITLDLSLNNFLSSMPGWMLNLSSLEHLDLRFNDFQGNIPLAIGNLKKLQVLDLSENSFDGHIPQTVGSLKSLQSLDLSENNINGGIPDTMENLKNLEYLDLWLNNITESIPETVGNLKSLKFLDLGWNSISGGIPETVGNLKSLESLDLSENKISESIPDTMGNLKSLKFLDLRWNSISGGIPETVGNLKSLESLDLSSNNISGEIPKTIGRLTKLQILSLDYNEISGEIPGTIGNLSELNGLSLSNNIINGQIPETVGNLHHLESFNLYNNSLGGVIPRTVGNLCNLSYFDASENNIGGEITGFMEGFSRCSTKILESINLGGNSLNGSIPASLGKLSALYELSLASNFLAGALTEAHFANLTSLSILDLSHNSLTVNVSQDWLPPYKASEIVMTSCSLGPKFPSWLRNQTDLYILDLSSVGISENFPDWFWGMGLPNLVLDVSHNHMKGKLPTTIKKAKNVAFYVINSKRYGILQSEITSLVRFMDLSNNLFSGPIPPTLAGVLDLGVLLLAHNRISGSIPSAFCEAKYLEVLSLANNDLSGVLPDCWNNSLGLRVIDFSDNKLSGGIPSSMGSLGHLRSLHLRNNNLSGKIPWSLQHCKRLITIDLGNNKLSGGIPEWIGESLSSLRVLRLRSNMLDGNIPMQLSFLASLQVLDLASNKFFGTLPPSFGNFKAMILIQHESKPILSGIVAFYYTENLLITMKSLELTFTNGLPLVTSIDLSNNNISGEIPEEFTRLHGLHFLNLSRNYLTGRIPKYIGAMGQLESLDLSMNNLSSTIPTSISNLNFLEHLNLSHNNLSGKIPSGTQLQSFDPSTYTGNQYLCGQPLPKKCPGDEPAGDPTAHGRQEKQDENENDSEMIWFYTSLSPGFVVGFWGFLGAMMLKRRTRYAYIQFIDRICEWIYMAAIINSARLKFKRNKAALHHASKEAIADVQFQFSQTEAGNSSSQQPEGSRSVSHQSDGSPSISAHHADATTSTPQDDAILSESVHHDHSMDHPDDEPIVDDIQIQDGSGRLKRRRGPTLVRDVWLLPEGERIVIECNKLGQPIKKAASLLTSFLGTVARRGQLCLLNYSKWNDMLPAYKIEMLRVVQWKEYRAKLKRDYKLEGRTEEQVVATCPPDVHPHQWMELVHYWFSERAQTYSDIGRAARAAKSVPHTAGSKSYARLRHEFADQQGREPGDVEFYRMTHVHQDGSFVRDESRDIYNRATSMISKRAGEGSSSTQSSRIEAEVFSELMGPERPGRVSGYGIGVTPTQLSEVCRYTRDTRESHDQLHVRQLQEEIAELRQTRDADRAEMQTIRSQLEHVTSMLHMFMSSQVPGAFASRRPDDDQPPTDQ